MYYYVNLLWYDNVTLEKKTTIIIKKGNIGKIVAQNALQEEFVTHNIVFKGELCIIEEFI